MYTALWSEYPMTTRNLLCSNGLMSQVRRWTAVAEGRVCSLFLPSLRQVERELG